MTAASPPPQRVESLIPDDGSDSSEPTLTTGQISELLHIHASTVKRWFEDVGPEATAGGHRRIPLTRILDIARERDHRVYLHDFEEDAPAVWRSCTALGEGDGDPMCALLYGWLLERRAYRIGLLLDHLVALELVPFADLLDLVFGGLMQRVGTEWERGGIRVGQERAASREVVEALLAVIDREGGRRSPHRPDAPTAVVGSMQGDHHFIGPLLVRAALVHEGWNVEYLGADVPIEEFLASQQAVGARLVCVSFTPPLGPPDVRRFLGLLAELGERSSPFAVAVGGSGVAGSAHVEGAGPTVRAIPSLAGLVAWARMLAEEVGT